MLHDRMCLLNVLARNNDNFQESYDSMLVTASTIREILQYMSGTWLPDAVSMFESKFLR